MLHTESTIYHVQLNTVCRGFANKRGVSFVPHSRWSFHGEEVLYTAFRTEKLPSARCEDGVAPTIDGMQALPAVLRIQSRLHLPLHPPLPPNSQPCECPWP